MANKTIPELDEIELVDVEDSHLLVLETGVATFKIRLDTLMPFIDDYLKRGVDVVVDGITTGDLTVDVSSICADARTSIWCLKKPADTPTFGEQTVVPLRTPDAATVTIVQGDFAMDAGTYRLITMGVP